MSNRLLGYGAQGFALEMNPWQTEESINTALLCRGAIVAGWANVESSLIEVAIRASRYPAYQGHRDSFPTKLKTRVTYLREIIELPGPLRPHAKLGRAVLDRYQATEDLRNMMAHARMQVLPGWGATFHFFQAASGSQIRYRTRRFTEIELQFLGNKAARFSRAVRRLVATINARTLLPPLSVAEEPLET